MKELKEEARRQHEEKLRAYGGKAEHRARGGEAKHSDEKEDKKLIREEVKPDALKHRAGGGPITGGSGANALGRKRSKPKGTNVNISLGKSDASPMPPLGAGPAIPPRPPVAPAPGVMKHGGHVKRDVKKHPRDKHEAKD